MINEITQKTEEPTEQVTQTQAKKGRKYKGRYRIKPGHKIWELSLITGAVVEAEFEKDVNLDYTKNVAAKILIEKENCIYLPALNKKNAEKKFNRILNSVKGL